MFATVTSFCLPIPVIAELLFAARNSSRQKENLKVYHEFINACIVLNITRETANHYSVVRLEVIKL
jgi:tRNA(fMet)-specific endonuclease VapC